MIGWRDGALAACFAAGCAAIGGSFCATAQEGPRPATACGGEIFARGTASRVIDGRTFVLDDGREVRLAAIEVPALPLPQEPGAASAGAAARDALASLLAGTEVVLRQMELQKTDRYGRVVAFAFDRARWRRTLGAGEFDCRGAGPGRRPGRQSRLRRGTPRPRKRGAERQAWPLGRFVL